MWSWMLSSVVLPGPATLWVGAARLPSLPTLCRQRLPLVVPCILPEARAGRVRSCCPSQEVVPTRT